jgi:Domain of unknown function (DUF4167)
MPSRDGGAARMRFVERVRIPRKRPPPGGPQSKVGDTQAMRNGQNNKRMRGRNRKSHNPLTRVYESNGPDVKIRGTPSHIAEKYVQLARDAQTSGDPVAAENYNQHAEHYLRLIATAQEQFRQNTPFFRPEGGGGDMRDDFGDEGDEDVGGMAASNELAQFGTRDPQPYLPRDAQFFPPRDQPPHGGRPQQQHHQQPQHQQPQHQQPQHHQPRGDDDGNVERLPSFITGGAGGSQGGGAPSNGQNGHDAQQGDRFPLHRRRRRHRGPRDVGQSGGGHSGEGDDAPQNPRGE